MILALDPGNTRSALVRIGTDSIDGWLLPNEQIRGLIVDHFGSVALRPHVHSLVVEQIESFGMAVGREVFETVFWSGRFVEAWSGTWHRVTRREVKLHLCGTSRAKDANIRQALIDRYGGKEVAIGRKAAPGPLYGFKADLWAALAVGVTYLDTRQGTETAHYRRTA